MAYKWQAQEQAAEKERQHFLSEFLFNFSWSHPFLLRYFILRFDVFIPHTILTSLVPSFALFYVFGIFITSRVADHFQHFVIFV